MTAAASTLATTLRGARGIVACSDFRPGDTVQIYMDIYWHFGIYIGGGMVIHAVKRHGGKFVFRVVCASLNDFADGRVLYRNDNIASDDRAAVCARAKAAVGRKYNFLFDNCEHFVHEMHGLVKECEQFYGIWARIEAAGIINAETARQLPPKAVLIFCALQGIGGYLEWAVEQKKIAQAAANPVFASA